MKAPQTLAFSGVTASASSINRVFPRVGADPGLRATGGNGVTFPEHGVVWDLNYRGELECGVGYWSIAPLERTVLAAAAQTHCATDVAIVGHLEMGTAAHEVVDLLVADGVAPDRLPLAHADRNPDPGLHAELVGCSFALSVGTARCNTVRTMAYSKHANVSDR